MDPEACGSIVSNLVRPRAAGPKPNPPRDGDKEQARRRVNVEVRTGRRAHPRSLPCVDCGQVWEPGKPRHEYDHHLGYSAEHHYDVQAVCRRCHARRGRERGEFFRGGLGNMAGLRPMPGASNPAAKLSPADVIEIRRRAAAGEFQRSIASSFGMSQAQIGNIVRGDSWKVT